MPTGPGANDANGIYQYGEDDSEALFSDLLNLSPTSISTVVTSLKSRLTALEGGVLHVQETAANGTAGGTFTAGAWQKRLLSNTALLNTITGASMASNQITLPAGTYEVTAFAPAYLVNLHKCKLRNVTDSSDIVMGSNEFSGTTSPVAQTTSRILAYRFTIAATKVLELQHRCSTTRLTDGLGLASSFAAITGPPAHVAAIEVYSEVRIKKVA